MHEHDRAMQKLQRTLPSSPDHGPARVAPPETVARALKLEEHLGRMRGIRQARVHPVDGVVKAILLVVPERSEHETDADVRTAAARIGLDPSQLQVQVMGARGKTGLPSRRKLSSLSTKRYGQRFSAQVTLELDGDALVGEVDVPMGRRFEYRSIARAVLEGVRRLIPYSLQLENVEIFNFGAERLAVVSIGSSEDILVGSALVRGDELDAIARATLDAINRVLNLKPSDLARVASTG